jgi:hypothetical protein
MLAKASGNLPTDSSFTSILSSLKKFSIKSIEDLVCVGKYIFQALAFKISA